MCLPGGALAEEWLGLQGLGPAVWHGWPMAF